MTWKESPSFQRWGLYTRAVDSLERLRGRRGLGERDLSERNVDFDITKIICCCEKSASHESARSGLCSPLWAEARLRLFLTLLPSSGLVGALLLSRYFGHVVPLCHGRVNGGCGQFFHSDPACIVISFANHTPNGAMPAFVFGGSSSHDHGSSSSLVRRAF